MSRSFSEHQLWIISEAASAFITASRFFLDAVEVSEVGYRLRRRPRVRDEGAVRGRYPETALPLKQRPSPSEVQYERDCPSIAPVRTMPEAADRRGVANRLAATCAPTPPGMRPPQLPGHVEFAGRHCRQVGLNTSPSCRSMIASVRQDLVASSSSSFNNGTEPGPA